jgi:glucosyl-dolichyl phosphate glucuronosyltransferase
MFISVLICTKNRAESLRLTLDSFFLPTNLQSWDWEAVIVDNDSADDTGQVCRHFRESFPGHFRSLVEKKYGKSNALNSAIAAARGDILAFTDDDVLCAPDYLQGIRTVFSQHTADGVQGRVLLDCEGGHPDWLDRYLGLTVGWRDDGGQVTDLDGTLCGTNMVLRAEVFRKISGFRPDLGPGPGLIGMGEDTELSLRMRQAGCRLLYAPQILIRHCLPRNRLTKGFIRKRFFRQGRAVAYYERLPTSLHRFGLWVIKEIIVNEAVAVGHLCVGHPALALRSQCEARGHAGFFWQHWLFKHGVARRLSGNPVSASEVEPQLPRRAL